MHARLARLPCLCTPLMAGDLLGMLQADGVDAFEQLKQMANQGGR